MTSTKQPIRILFVDDDEDDFILTRDMLKEIPHQKYVIDWASSFDSSVKIMERGKHDVFLVDYRIGESTGIDLLNHAVKNGYKEPFIMLTGKGDRTINMTAMKSGAADYLIKDKIDAYVLERTIYHALERARATETIKESEYKYRSIFKNSKDVIYLIDKEGKFIDINKSATLLFGYTREELLQMNIKQLCSDENGKEFIEETLFNKEEITDFELLLLSKSGEKIFCLITLGALFKRSDSLALYQGIIHDITKRKKAEQAIITMEKQAVSGRIVQSLAHEVRNPLTSVTLAFEQLKEEHGQGNPDKEAFAAYFDIVQRNCERINQLIKELLNLTKPIQFKFQNCPINKLLDESLELASDRIRLKKIKIEKNYAATAPIVSVDMEKMKTAFLNIFINAIEAMSHGNGVLKIRTETKNNQCIITIADNGTGIKSEDLNKLFEPFYSSKNNGIGLGLSNTQNIILNHKGSIDVESDFGKGTRFIIGFYLLQ